MLCIYYCHARRVFDSQLLLMQLRRNVMADFAKILSY